jgi:hypothetical protein
VLESLAVGSTKISRRRRLQRLQACPVRRFQIPEGSEFPLRLEAKVNYRKFNDRYARWALKEQYQAIPIVEMASATAALAAPDQ